jgi:hypothetical protein
LLIGIVKKNAIMMIDFALEAERKHGKSAVEAIEEASWRTNGAIVKAFGNGRPGLSSRWGVGAGRPGYARWMKL